MNRLLILACFLLSGCHSKQDLPFFQQKTTKIFVLPFGNFSKNLASHLISDLKKLNPQIVLLKPTFLPTQAWYGPRQRYRADSLIYWLKNKVNDGEVIVGITSKDISATKNGIKDYGIIGLGFTPGRSCMVSTFRLDKNNLEQQFFKVVIHELGHTQGLNHCEVKTCFMRDAEGGNPTNEEKEFCERCRKVLIEKGWNL